MNTDPDKGDFANLSQVESVISRHPLVRTAAVRKIKDCTGTHLVAYVARRRESDRSGDDCEKPDVSHIAHWRSRYEKFYSQAEAPNPYFDTRGWNDSFTGQAISSEEMHEWLDDTVATLAALKPRSVLEIGCGSGLILFRLAPLCSKYVATDFSAVAIDRLGRELARVAPALDHVSLIHQSADNFDGLDSLTFDLVVFNSIVQYFPSINYLIKVIKGAVGRTSSNGYVFLGDLRSHALLEPFHLSLEFRRALPSLPLIEFRKIVAAAIYREDELLVQPHFFRHLQKSLSRINHVEVFPKRGRRHNELNRFRYQALLYIEQGPTVVSNLTWHDWSQSFGSLKSLEDVLRQNRPPSFALANIPNARLSRERVLSKLLTDRSSKTVGDLCEQMSSADHEGVDPEDVIGLGEILEYEVRLSWLEHDANGAFDAVFLPAKSGIPAYRIPQLEQRHFSELANAPAQRLLSNSLSVQLRQLLLEQFPLDNIPSIFIDASELPPLAFADS